MSYINKLAGKIYDQSQRGWLGGKINDIVGDDYQKHLINTSLGGLTPMGPAYGYKMDYDQARDEGESGWNRVGGNAQRSAAILAAILGGAMAGGAGGGAASGGGGGGGILGGLGGGGAAEGGAASQGSSFMNPKMLGMIGNMMSSQGQSQNQSPNYRYSTPDFSQPAFMQSQPQDVMSSGYSPAEPNRAQQYNPYALALMNTDRTYG